MHCIELYSLIYHQDPENVAFCPYRISPLGAHIDHQFGKINGLAINKGIHFAYKTKHSGICEIQSVNFPGKRAQFHVSSIPETKQGDRADHLCGAALKLAEKHKLKYGVAGVLEGSLPIGGLSSSAAVITYALLHGFKGISFLAKLCIYLFFGLLIVVLLIGGQGRFIIENGFQSLGKMFQNFIELSTFTDPGRTSNFPQDWTIYYWAYWMVWCIAAPFFIGNISRGRTIKQTILGGYVFGVGSTIVSFIVLGNYSLGLQTSGAADFIAEYAANGDLYGLILNIINTMPASKFILVVTMLCMIAFYATSFDSIAYTAACYSYKRLLCLQKV